MIDLFKSKRASSVLGIALDGNRLEAVVVRRSNGALHVRQCVTATLALSPMTDDPQLVAREIRNHLDGAGIREKRCAVCLPLSWLLTMQTKVPDLPEADRAGYLQLEAERGFHSGSETLFPATSLVNAPSGEMFATLLAVPRSNLGTLEQVLRAAKLKPQTFGLGIVAMQPAADVRERVIALAIRTNSIDLQVSGGGGIIALRSLDGAVETEGAQKRISADLVAREIRITLGQLPGGFSEGPGKIRIFGQGELARQFVNDITPRLTAIGLTVEAVERAATANFDKALSPEIAASPAVALAGAWVSGAQTNPELLPPRVHPWQQMFAAGLSTRKLVWTGEAVGGIVACVLIAFGLQQWQISSLESKWRSMEPTVTALNNEQALIKKFGGFYDQTYRDLRIWKRLSEIFPLDSSVNAKTIEIRDVSTVYCSGTVRDNAAFLLMRGKLEQDTNEISNLHAEVRGQRPMQFTASFQWENGGANGN